jgi:predicted TIM-barrel fold metal-dependent hydrolase
MLSELAMPPAQIQTFIRNARTEERKLSHTVDVHIHLSERSDDQLIPFARLNGMKYNLGELLRLMEENGIAQGLLLSPPLKDYAPLPNGKVIELCRKSKGKLSPILTVEPSAQKVRDAIRAASTNKGYVRGFKILLGYIEFFASDPVYAPLYDYAESEELPVMFHTGDTSKSTGSLTHAHPLTLDPLANERGELKIVACHFGNPWIMDVAELIYKHPNVYADISGLSVGGSKYSSMYLDWLSTRLSEAIHFAGGTDKVIFGTDYPIMTHEAAFKLVGKLRIERGDVEKILWKNAKKVFGL